jgi:hypothetical protein
MKWRAVPAAFAPLAELKGPEILTDRRESVWEGR